MGTSFLGDDDDDGENIETPGGEIVDGC